MKPRISGKNKQEESGKLEHKFQYLHLLESSFINVMTKIAYQPEGVFNHPNFVCLTSKQESGTVQRQHFSSDTCKTIENCHSRLFENNCILQTCKIRLLQPSLKKSKLVKHS